MILIRAEMISHAESHLHDNFFHHIKWIMQTNELLNCVTPPIHKSRVNEKKFAVERAKSSTNADPIGCAFTLKFINVH